MVLVGSADTKWLDNWIPNDILLIEKACITEIELVYVGVGSSTGHTRWHAILLTRRIVDIERIWICDATESVALKACTDVVWVAVFEVCGVADSASCVVSLILG